MDVRSDCTAGIDAVVAWLQNDYGRWGRSGESIAHALVDTGLTRRVAFVQPQFGRRVLRHDMHQIRGVDVHRVTGHPRLRPRWFGRSVRRRSALNHPLLLNCGLARANWFFHRAFSPSASTTVLVVHDTPHLRTELTSAERTRLATLRSRLIEASHMVIGLSEGAIAGITGAHYVGHGCDEIWGDAKVDDATEPADLRAIPHPRAIYLGSLSARVHVEALEALATSGVHVVVVGFRPNAAIQHLFDTHENVHFLGSRTPAESAAYLLHSDVGIVPHTDEPFTRSMEPHKVYNYACAGLRTVMLNGGAPRRLQTLVVPTMTVVDFVDATWSAIRAGRITSDQIEASRALTWARVTREILDLVPVTPSSGWIAPQPPTRSS